MTKAFPEDRSTLLFGREADVLHLLNRASQTGMTAVVAQPLMGKTWTLTEVARRLLAERQYLVGYHESKGVESSHLLYTVADLYTRWLADSTMREQALSLWDRHKDSLVPRIGQMVGTLFEKLAGKQLPEGVASVVRSAFDGLAKAQEDLLSGGLQIAPLPYDQALSLTDLVAKVSKRHIVFILDSWEKSPSIRSEFATLEVFLKRQEDWPHTHIFVAVRNPELDSSKVNDEAIRRASDLCRISSASQLYQLPPMRQNDAYEGHCIARFVQNTVPAAKNQSEQTILEMIGGFPGVLDFWTNEANRTTMRTKEDLQNNADNAQALRYLELEHLLNGLQDERYRTLAARLAFFPRLSRETWATFRDVLLGDLSITAIDALVDANVLSDECFPTYGHDTRHSAARQWFIKQRRPLIRRVSEQLVEAIASFTLEIDSELPYLEALVGCSETARQIGMSPTAYCLIEAAQAAFGEIEAVYSSEFDEIYPNVVQQNCSVVPLIAIALLHRGAEKELHGDIDGAIEDFTAACALPNAPAEIVPQMLFRLGNLKRSQGDNDGAIEDYSASIAQPNAPADLVSLVLSLRGSLKKECGDSGGALDDFSAICALPDAPVDSHVHALLERGTLKGMSGDSEGAINDFSAAIDLPNAPDDMITKAFINRGIVKVQMCDSDGAFDDYSAAINLPNAPAYAVASALFHRGVLKKERGDNNGAIEDCSAAINLPDAPADEVGRALFLRGALKYKEGDSGGAIHDFTAAIEQPNALVDNVALALIYRGVLRLQEGDSDGACNDINAAINLPNTSANLVELTLQRLTNDVSPSEISV